MQTVKLGSKGEEVFLLETLLTKVGYVNVSPDGNFDKILDEKVRKFQGLRNLKVDGEVGPKTWTAVFEAAFPKGVRIEGVDISHHENDDLAPLDINWAAMRKSFWFCYVKATQGAGYQDPKFGFNMQKLAQIQMPRGGYHFMDFFAEGGVETEIANFLENCPLDWSAKGVLPPCLDVEPTRSGDDKLERKIARNQTEIIKNVKIWLETVEKETGRQPLIYTSRRVWDDLLGGAKGFDKYVLWLADYRKSVTQPTPPKGWNGRYDIWQYSENGAVGNNKGFDVNRLNMPYADFLKLANF